MESNNKVITDILTFVNIKIRNKWKNMFHSFSSTLKQFKITITYLAICIFSSPALCKPSIYITNLSGSQNCINFTNFS